MRTAPVLDVRCWILDGGCCAEYLYSKKHTSGAKKYLLSIIHYLLSKVPLRSGRTKTVCTVYPQRNSIKVKFVGASLEPPEYFTRCTVYP